MRDRRARIALLAALSLGAVAARAAAQCNTSQLCPAGADPCEITAACTVAAGSTFDIRPRSLVIKEGKVLTIGEGADPLTIRAGSILFEKGGRIVATGTRGAMGGSGGSVTLEATTTFTMQSQGNTNSRVDTVGEISGGIVDISAGGNVTVNGAILANSSSPNGFGGIVEVLSEAGTAHFMGTGLQAMGGANGENGASGGSIGVYAHGDVTIDAPFDVSGGDCVCDIAIESANGNVVTTPAGDFNLRGKGGIGDGGSTSLAAGGNVTMGGDVFAPARGSGGEDGFGGGFGGDLDVYAGGNLALSGRVDLDGASPDGDGGAADLEAEGDITVNGLVGAPVEGFGSGGDVSLLAGRDVFLNHTIDVGADDFGGAVDATAVGTVRVAGTIDAATPPDGFGGTILIQGCTIETTAASRLDARGLGTFPAATNYLHASNTTTTRGRMLAGAANRIDWLATPPTVIPPAGSPPLITPAVTTVQNPGLPCCVACQACGDGVVDGTEQCDDGNTAGGDCCSATCLREPAGSPCASDQNACTRDVCDDAGVCAHPAGNAGAACRPAAGACDVAETCTGISPTCPVDAKSTAECRAAAGACDVAERCDGQSNHCPADAFQPTTTTCRPAAGECDVADVCSGTSAACGADLKRTSVCRESAGACDVAEHCDGAGDTCPADAMAVDGTRCGGNACTAEGTCTAGVCSSGPTGACGPCEACDPELGCVAAPRTGCAVPVQSRKAQLQVKDSPKGEASDQLAWKWLKGSATTAGDFGDPATADGLDLCVFDRSQAVPRLVFRAHVPPGRMCGTKPCWVDKGAKGFTYADKLGTPDGITQLTLTPGTDGKARILVRGKGTNLSTHAFGLPAPPVMLPLTVQLQSAAGGCWEASYSAQGASKNTFLEFNGKAD